MAWRKSWARNWGEVRYCSDACRRRKLNGIDRDLEAAILDLLDARNGTICPSEAARHVAGAHVTAGKDGPADDEAWRELMEPARQAARRLVARDEVEITQGGHVVDPSTAKGPIRIRRVRRG